MVVEAISACKKDCLEVEPRTGKPVACSLVGMLSMLSSSRVARILTGLAVEMAHNEELAVAVREGLMKPNREVVLAALRRGGHTGGPRPPPHPPRRAGHPARPHSPRPPARPRTATPGASHPPGAR